MSAHTVASVMHALEAAGSEQTRRIYLRHGAQAPLFGVAYAALNGLKKLIRTDTALAEALWATGNHDARILALMLADAGTVPPALLEIWAGELTNHVLGDALSAFVARTPHARALALAWIDRDHEWIEYAGWCIVGALADLPDALSDAECAALLERIEREIGAAKNRVRHGMNQALIGIGIRGGALREAADAAAGRIGKVVVDHGATDCVTPDARAYIEKTLAHRARKAAPRA